MFVYLIIIAVMGIIITLGIDYARTRRSILHTLRKSCTINHVQFEHDMRGTAKEAKKALGIMRARTIQLEKHVVDLNEIVLRHVKSYIRKRLRSRPTLSSTDSPFIKKLQEDTFSEVKNDNE